MNRKQIYKCNICENIIEVLDAKSGVLTCCSQPMSLREGNTVDAAVEKHVPVIEKKEGGILVKVGSVTHPMEEKHYIQWIEIIDGETSCRHFLKPGESPEKFFSCVSENIQAREYCNLHGLWES